jgi:hypothetical protein
MKIATPSHVRRITGVLAGGLLAGLAMVAGPVGSASAQGCTTTWRAPVSGTWGTSSSWTNGVPTSASMACLPASGSSYSVLGTGRLHAAGLSVGSHARLTLQSGPFTGGAALTVGGYGLSNAGTLDSADTVGYGSYLGVDPGATLSNTGTVRVYGRVHLDANVVNASSGTLQASPWGPNDQGYVRALRNDGGILRVDPQARLRLDRLDSLSTSGELGAGTYDVEGSVTLGTSQAPRVLTNSADVTFTRSGAVTDAEGNDVFGLLATNRVGGTLHLVRSTKTFLRTLTNLGDLSLSGATLRAPGYIQAAGITTVASGSDLGGGPVDVSGGSLVAGGTITGDLRNSALVRLDDAGATRLHVAGTYTQTSDGILGTYVGTTPVTCTAGPQPASCLQVDGAVTLDGTLGVMVDPAASPTVGATYVLSTTPVSTTGRFQTVLPTFGPVPSGYGILPSSYARTVTLKVSRLPAP